MSKITIEKGDTYGRLTVTDSLGKNKGRHYFLCLCTCGNTTTVEYYNLKSGHTRSCGCYMRDRIVETSLKHGHLRNKRLTPEYQSWSHIQTRCNNPKDQSFNYYGGRGIKCSWNSFEEFLGDMGTRPSPKHSIDRIDNNGHYCKENCRWATAKEQNNNQRSNRLITYKNETMTMKQMAEKYKISYKTFFSRFVFRKWSVERTITTPIRKRLSS